MENENDNIINKNQDSEDDAEQQDNGKSEETIEPSLEERLKEAEDKVLRTLAETENQRRRFEKEVKDAFEYGGFDFAKESLAILDNLQRAKTSIKNDEELKKSKDLEKFLKNIDIVEKDLISIFERNKIKKINSTKEKFNPNLHQAMLEVEDDTAEPGTIVQEIQPGYMYGERLLRPSFVGVSKKKGQETQQNDEKKDDDLT